MKKINKITEESNPKSRNIDQKDINEILLANNVIKKTEIIVIDPNIP